MTRQFSRLNLPASRSNLPGADPPQIRAHVLSYMTYCVFR